MTDIATQKSRARQAAFAVRKVAHGNYRGSSATDNLLKFLSQHRGRPVSAYMPIRTEIDCLPAMAELARSAPVSVPVILGSGRPLEFQSWQPNSDMMEGPFGAKVPVQAEVVIPEIVIMPLLAFDARGYRLGYGGGFYDRTLEKLRSSGPVLAIGFAYAAQETRNVPTEPTDERMDAVVTENGMHLCHLQSPGSGTRPDL